MRYLSENNYPPMIGIIVTGERGAKVIGFQFKNRTFNIEIIGLIVLISAIVVPNVLWHNTIGDASFLISIAIGMVFLGIFKKTRKFRR